MSEMILRFSATIPFSQPEIHWSIFLTLLPLPQIHQPMNAPIEAVKGPP